MTEVLAMTVGADGARGTSCAFLRLAAAWLVAVVPYGCVPQLEEGPLEGGEGPFESDVVTRVEGETVLFGFDSGLEGFELDLNNDVDSVSASSGIYQVREPGVDGEPGRLVVLAHFDGYPQKVHVQAAVEGRKELEVDSQSKVLRVYIQVVAGFTVDPQAGAGACITVKTGDEWVWGQGGWQLLDANSFGQWYELELDLDDPDADRTIDNYDPSDIRVIGIMMSTGGNEGFPQDPEPVPTPSLFYVDRITLSPE